MIKSLAALLRWLVVVLTPVVLILTMARFLVADWYPRFEYGRPGFPPDSYGFNSEQRLDLALVAIHYLNAPGSAEQTISMLTEQRIPGTAQPLYNQYEISHMIDVKRVMSQLWRVQIVALLVVAVSLALLLSGRETRAGGYWALMMGGLFNTILLVVMGAFVLLGWQTFFIQFHEVFFPPGSWTFEWTDSLIRLFPDRFWFEAGAIIVLGTLAAGLLLALAGKLLLRRTSTARPVAAMAT